MLPILAFIPYAVLPYMSKDDREELASLERLLTGINDKIKDAEKKGATDQMAHMLAVRDKCEQDVNRLRDKIGY